MTVRTLLWLGVVFGMGGVAAAPVCAQAAVRLSVFPTAIQDPALRDLASALDPVVLSELDALAQVTVAARPPLDLPATQLALDCVGETSACLRSVAEQAGVEALLAPSLERAGEETVVTLLYFDARGEGGLRSVARRHRGEHVERAVLDAVPGLVRELFGVPAEEPQQAQDPAAAADAPPPVDERDFGFQEPAPGRSAFPAVPVAITATGLAVLGAGVAFGLLSRASEDEYGDQEVQTREDVDRALELRDEARDRALIANIGYGLGGALIVVGAAIWIAELFEDAEHPPRAQLAPVLAPSQLGLAVFGQFGEDGR